MISQQYSRINFSKQRVVVKLIDNFFFFFLPKVVSDKVNRGLLSSSACFKLFPSPLDRLFAYWIATAWFRRRIKPACSLKASYFTAETHLSGFFNTRRYAKGGVAASSIFSRLLGRSVNFWRTERKSRLFKINKFIDFFPRTFHRIYRVGHARLLVSIEGCKASRLLASPATRRLSYSSAEILNLVLCFMDRAASLFLQSSSFIRPQSLSPGNFFSD